MTTAVVDARTLRRRRVLDLIERSGVDALVLRRPENFAWYTAGGNSRVEYASPVGAADVVISESGEWVVASAIEAPRMRAEETPDFQVLEHPWELGPAAVLRELAGGGRLGVDLPLPGTVDLSEPVAALRRVLDADAIERLRGVGADLAAAMRETAARIRPDMREHDAAAVLAAACRRRALVPTVLLAAGERRIPAHRHPLPTGEPLGSRAMLVASAQRGGLYANLTRIVDFDQPDAATARRERLCHEILVRMRSEATRPGRTLAEAFADCRRFYADAGFPGEWRLHHQGGLTGYASREVIATPGTAVPIEIGQAFAWNPSITGAKAEETFVLTEDGPEVVTEVLV